MFRRDRDDVPILGNNWGRSDGVEMRRYTGGSNSADVLVTIPYDGGPDFGLSEKRHEGMDGGRRGEYVSSVTSNGIGTTNWDSHGVSYHDYLYKSGRLGMCNDPNCVDCPADFRAKVARKEFGLYSYRKRFGNVFQGDANNWARKSFSFVKSYFPIASPHEKRVQHWNRFFVTSCLLAIFIDPLFFFSLAVEKDNSCVVFDLSYAAVIVALRSVTDVIYLLHMFFQFRIAYVAPESRITGSGDLVTDPRKIALHYLRGYFLLDLLAVLPLPQVLVLVVISTHLGSSADYTKNLMRLTILFQYLPRIIRFLPLGGGQTGSRFIFESAWANFVLNLLMFVLAGHVVGSCWYLFGFQRVNRCLKDACRINDMKRCSELVDCGRGRSQLQLHPDLDQGQLKNWIINVSINCFGNAGGDQGFDYGIYQKAPIITTKNIFVRYVYSLFWGFQLCFFRNLSNMGLSGILSPNISSLTALTDILLGSNSISGSIPDLSRLKQLRRLHLQDNQFSGELPSSLGLLGNLQELFVQNNNLTGVIPRSLVRGLYKVLILSPLSPFKDIWKSSLRTSPNLIYRGCLLKQGTNRIRCFHQDKERTYIFYPLIFFTFMEMYLFQCAAERICHNIWLRNPYCLPPILYKIHRNGLFLD